MFTSLSRRLATFFAALIVAVPVATMGGSADAVVPIPVGKKVTSQSVNANVTCVLTVKSYNPFTNKVYGLLRANIAARTLSQSLTNAYSEAYCWAFGNGATSAGFADVLARSNSASANLQKSVVLDYDTSYALCGTGAVISRNGTTTFVPVNCVS